MLTSIALSHAIAPSDSPPPPHFQAAEAGSLREACASEPTAFAAAYKVCRRSLIGPDPPHLGRETVH
jgi:hypothetical protein